MLKKIILLFVIITLAQQASAGIIVGKNYVITVDPNQKYLNSENAPIVLKKPEDLDNKIELISMEAFLKNKELEQKMKKARASKKQAIINIAQPKPAVKRTFVRPTESKTINKQAESTKMKELESYLTSHDKEVKIERKEPITKNALNTSDLYISYTSDKNTLLSANAKKELQELVNKLKGAKFNIVTYAAGEDTMARRVSLLRANIIKNALKGYNVSDANIKIKALGNKININQAKISIAK